MDDPEAIRRIVDFLNWQLEHPEHREVVDCAWILFLGLVSKGLVSGKPVTVEDIQRICEQAFEEYQSG